MKRFFLVIVGIALCYDAAWSQLLQPETIEPYELGISEVLTTHLIFSSKIKMIDRGDAGILAQLAPGQENILQIKGAAASFIPTNLTVITSDGQLYSFLTHYEKQPLNLTLSFNQSQSINADSIRSVGVPNELNYKEDARLVKKSKKRLRAHSYRKDNVILRLTGWFVCNNTMYCRLVIDNRSTINYPIESLRFTICDKIKMKRSAVQELPIVPVYIQGNQSILYANTKQEIIVAFNSFTLAHQKYLKIQLFEQNGGRYLQLKVDDRTINKAKKLKS